MITDLQLASGRRLLSMTRDVCAPFPTPERAVPLMMATLAVESAFGILDNGGNGRRQGGFDFQSMRGAFGVAQQELMSIRDGLAMQCPPNLPQPWRALWSPANAEHVANLMCCPCGCGDALSLFGCREHYRRAPGALPEAGNTEHQWLYYKLYYNSTAGATTRAQYMSAWNGLCVPILT
jgi:hypothetical protein